MVKMITIVILMTIRTIKDNSYSKENIIFKMGKRKNK